PLGRTSLRVSPIGLGTVKLGRTTGLKYASPTPPTLPTDEQALALLTVARDLGVNVIDTAPAYGVAEARLGALLPRVFRRDQYNLITKAGEIFDPHTAASTYDFSVAHLTASIEQSLATLRVEHLDVVLLHFRSADDLDARTLRQGDALATLLRLRDRGLIRAVGASTGSDAAGQLAITAGCDVVMLTLQADATADRLIGDTAALQAASTAQTGVLVKKPLASGHTSLPPAAAIARLTATPAVHCAIVGTANPAHLAELAAAIAR
ncbi:MAG: aldo/keto reductase, partial [Phycisphaerales bacterium]|nr:aldo/keto reductase [Phycisphaerales bacterium]